ncbi:tyrosine-type recombinase/integrase [Streptomyces sp. 3214.6]|uniref:tyrosine-type recombinase/integrase n=1 Tax=Streptomyces sp. 3214.6 TaxID=1882757 RepID=UPI001E5D0F83|nr:tyrosine-type recombinase/integrase [Streptomyces sp. 3214.6]
MMRDVRSLRVRQIGRLVAVADAPIPYQLLDVDGGQVRPVTDYFRELTASDYSPHSLRSYGLALLRWLRFLDAVDTPWDKATRTDVTDFVLWMREATKPGRPNRKAGQTNPVTAKRYLSRKYAPATIDHNLAVLREFYDHHLSTGAGPLVNPVPAVRTVDGGRVNAHHNPMETFRWHRRAPLRQRRPQQTPRNIPDRLFNQVFAALRSNRDRALMAFFISTGARASELVGVTNERLNIGQQLIGVIRKGTRALQWLPASTDAFVWLKLYRHELTADAPRGPGAPLWVTLRRPWKPLTYDAARMVFTRANETLGTNWTLHDLRHAAAHRMVDDPKLSLTDIQWVLGHSQITTTQIYTEPRAEDVIERMRAHYDSPPQAVSAPKAPAEGYRPEVLATLLGGAGAWA